MLVELRLGLLDIINNLSDNSTPNGRRTSSHGCEGIGKNCIMHESKKTVSTESQASPVDISWGIIKFQATSPLLRAGRT